MDKNRESSKVYTVSVNCLYQSHTPVCRFTSKVKKEKGTHTQTRC